MEWGYINDRFKVILTVSYVLKSYHSVNCFESSMKRRELITSLVECGIVTFMVVTRPALIQFRIRASLSYRWIYCGWLLILVTGYDSSLWGGSFIMGFISLITMGLVWISPPVVLVTRSDTHPIVVIFNRRFKDSFNWGFARDFELWNTLCRIVSQCKVLCIPQIYSPSNSVSREFFENLPSPMNLQT